MIIPIYIPRINPNKQHKQGQDVDNDPDGLLIGQLSIWSAKDGATFVSDVPAAPQPSRDNLCCSFSIERHTHSPRVSGSNISLQFQQERTYNYR